MRCIRKHRSKVISSLVFQPDLHLVVDALKACTAVKDLEAGKVIHRHIVRDGHSDIYVLTALVNMYSRSSSLAEAHQVFDTIPAPNVVSWTALILGYADNGQGDDALHLLSRMHHEGCHPNARTYVAGIKACSRLRINRDDKLAKGKVLHEQAREAGCDCDLYVCNSLVDLYSFCGSLVDARRVFSEMPIQSVVSFNALMLGYAENGEEEQALEVFDRMKDRGFHPDGRSFVAVVKACAGLAGKECGRNVCGDLVKVEALELGFAVHSDAVHHLGWNLDVILASSFVDMYGKCGSLLDARRVFDRMSSHDVVAWTTLVLGYTENNEPELALELFLQMKREGCLANARTLLAAAKACTALAREEAGAQVDGGKIVKVRSLERGRTIHSEATLAGCDADLFMVTTLVNMYAVCGSLPDAAKVFEAFQNVSSSLHETTALWNTLIQGSAENDETDRALELYLDMNARGCQPDARTYAAVLKAGGTRLDAEVGKELYADISRHGLETDQVLATCLIDFFAKCGSLSCSRRLFDSLQTVDHVAWTAVMTGYSHRGDAESVVDMFHSMQEAGLTPDEVIFSCVLTACSHAGLVETGRRYFSAMSLPRYGLVPRQEHYQCLVDLLARADLVEEAMVVVRSMPRITSSMTWMTLLAASCKSKDVSLAQGLFKSLQGTGDFGGHLEVRSCALLLMSKLYASQGMWEEQAKIELP